MPASEALPAPPGGSGYSLFRLLGGEAAQLALFNLAGYPVTPMPLSLGLIAYSFSGRLQTVDSKHLVTSPSEIPLSVIDLATGRKRANRSWLLGRLFKTYGSWMSPEVRETGRRFQASRLAGTSGQARPLCVTVYDWSQARPSGVPALDWVWFAGLMVTAVQLSIAAVPFRLNGDVFTLVLVVAGNTLSHAVASRLQGVREKWSSWRLREAKTVALTLGKGTNHVVIVRGGPGDLDLEDLATAEPSYQDNTRLFAFAVVSSWVWCFLKLLVDFRNGWFLIAAGALGTLHNLVAARAPRRPHAHGFPLEMASVEGSLAPSVFAHENAMWTLMDLETGHEGWGKALLGEFFPGELKEWERAWWSNPDRKRRKQLRREVMEAAEEPARRSSSGASFGSGARGRARGLSYPAMKRD